MLLTILRNRRRDGEDTGATLVELIVVMGVFGIFITLFTAATTSMFGQLRRQQGTADNLDTTRKVIALLDKQVRYANAITAPGIGTDGNRYVEWRTGNAGQQQTCTQWRWVATTSQLEYRTWQPPLSGVGSVTATSWMTEAGGITRITGVPIFSLTASANANREALTVAFVSTHGKPSKSTNSQVTLTGLNTTSSSAPSGAICAEVGRP